MKFIGRFFCIIIVITVGIVCALTPPVETIQQGIKELALGKAESSIPKIDMKKAQAEAIDFIKMQNTEYSPIKSLSPETFTEHIAPYLSPADVARFAQTGRQQQPYARAALSRHLDLRTVRSIASLQKAVDTYAGPELQTLNLDRYNVRLGLLSEGNALRGTQQWEKGFAPFMLSHLNWAFLKKCTNLKILHLGVGRLTLIPEEFESLISLKKLYLNANLLQINSELQRIPPHVTVLDLAANKLIGIPQSFEKFSELEDLDLRGNIDLARGDTSVLGTLKNLKKLDIRGCAFQQMPEWIVHLKKLEFLGINLPYGADYSLLDELPALKKIDIYVERFMNKPNITHIRPETLPQRIALVMPQGDA